MRVMYAIVYHDNFDGLEAVFARRGESAEKDHWYKNITPASRCRLRKLINSYNRNTGGEKVHVNIKNDFLSVLLWNE